MTMKSRSGKPAYDKSLRPVRQPGQMGDWAALIAVALSVGLWTLWPSAPAQIREFPRLPEPTCAYGKLSQNSSAGNVLARFNDNPADEDADNAFARLPVATTPPIPAPSPALAAALPPPAYPAKAQELPLPTELPPAPDFPFKRPFTARTGLVVRVSESLRNGGFVFDPPAASNDTPFSLSADLVFNGDGLAESVLINSLDSADANFDIARWESALLLAHAATNAVGTVEITRR